MQINVGFQREIMRGTVLSADYIRNVFTRYELGVDTNHVGDSRFLDVAAAQAAIRTNQWRFRMYGGCGAGIHRLRDCKRSNDC